MGDLKALSTGVVFDSPNKSKVSVSACKHYYFHPRKTALYILFLEVQVLERTNGGNDLQFIATYCLYLLVLYASNKYVNELNSRIRKNIEKTTHLTEICAVEVGVHVAPHFCTRHVGNVACPCEVEPVSLIELGPNEEVQVSDAVILPH